MANVVPMSFVTERLIADLEHLTKAKIYNVRKELVALVDKVKETGTSENIYGLGTFYRNKSGTVSFRVSDSFNRRVDAPLEEVEPDGFPMTYVPKSDAHVAIMVKALFSLAWEHDQPVTIRGLGRFSIRQRKVVMNNTIVWTFGFYQFAG